MKVHHFILLIVTVVLIGSWFLWPKITTQEPVDELMGTWRGQASAESEYLWWMEYKFVEKHRYTLTTDSGYTEDGTYEITERFLDGSILVKKSYANGTKEYEMAVMTTEDSNSIFIEGTRLYRQ